MACSGKAWYFARGLRYSYGPRAIDAESAPEQDRVARKNGRSRLESWPPQRGVAQLQSAHFHSLPSRRGGPSHAASGGQAQLTDTWWGRAKLPCQRLPETDEASTARQRRIDPEHDR